MNSREKGKRGERQWRDELRANGYEARRGQQFCGSAESPDVVCDSVPWVHFEVKCVERLNIEDAMNQARRDCGVRNAACGMKKVPVVAHKRNFCRWLVTMDAETFFRLLRGDFPVQPPVDSLAPASPALNGPSPLANGAPTLANCCPSAEVRLCGERTFCRLPGDANLRGVLPPANSETNENKQTETKENV